MRSAISDDSEARSLRKADRAGRVTPSASAASVTESPRMVGAEFDTNILIDYLNGVEQADCAPLVLPMPGNQKYYLLHVVTGVWGDQTAGQFRYTRLKSAGNSGD